MLTDMQRSMVEENKGLAYRVANALWRRYPSIRAAWSQEDLQQQALLIMMEIVKSGKWNPERGKFSTYATFVMRQRLYRYAIHHGLICSPENTHSLDKYKGLYLKTQACGQLPLRLLDRERDQDDQLDCLFLSGKVEQLPPVLQTVIKRVYWYNWTHQSVANSFGWTRQRVSQLVKRALTMLREDLNVA